MAVNTLFNQLGEVKLHSAWPTLGCLPTAYLVTCSCMVISMLPWHFTSCSVNWEKIKAQ